MKLLLDTDIGSDIDDAVCLAYLLAQPDCELLGITTVTGDVDARARMASALCQVANKQIPIYPGAPDPLQIPQRQPLVPQAAALARWPHQIDFAQNEAVQFLTRTIYQHPGEITLLTIGPLTNIAKLFTHAPECAGLLRAIYIMGGVLPGHAPQYNDLEWNIIVDPHAADIVYRTPVAIHRTVGIQVTRQVRMSAEEVRRRFMQHKLLVPVLDFAETGWLHDVPEIIFHDPLTSVVIFSDDVCGYERGTITVDLSGDDNTGQTGWVASPDGPHEFSMTVDSERFFTRYFEVFQ